MSKLSIVMVCPTEEMPRIPDHERDVIYRFFNEYTRGLNAQHHKRWLRFGRRLVKSEPGETQAFYPAVDRSRKFHSRWMAIEARVFENQDAYVHPERFTDWLKTGAGFGEYHLVNGRMKFVPGSRKYDECSDDEMREFAEAATAFLRSPRATRRLWPHLNMAQRAEMIETLLADPKKDQPQ